MEKKEILECPYCLTKNRVVKDKLNSSRCGICTNPLVLNRDLLRYSILHDLFNKKYNDNQDEVTFTISSQAREMILAIDYLVEQRFIKEILKNDLKYQKHTFEYTIKINAKGIDKYESYKVGLEILKPLALYKISDHQISKFNVFYEEFLKSEIVRQFEASIKPPTPNYTNPTFNKIRIFLDSDQKKYLSSMAHYSCSLCKGNGVIGITPNDFFSNEMKIHEIGCYQCIDFIPKHHLKDNENPTYEPEPRCPICKGSGRYLIFNSTRTKSGTEEIVCECYEIKIKEPTIILKSEANKIAESNIGKNMSRTQYRKDKGPRKGLFSFLKS